jgi:hypothetical protein
MEEIIVDISAFVLKNAITSSCNYVVCTSHFPEICVFCGY